MKYEELISQLCEVIKESENNAQQIYENIENIENIVQESEASFHSKEKIENLISKIFALLQHQDLHRQKIERVVNFVCEKNNIDKSIYNLAPSAKNIDSNNQTLSSDELEELIKQMQN